MINANLERQLMITVDNRVGALSEITEIISAEGINLLAVCAYVIDRKGFILFISNDNKKAKRLLEQKKYAVREEDVVLISLDNKPGALQNLCKKISDLGIDITLLYGSVSDQAKASKIVLVSEDNSGILKIVKMLA